MAHLSYVNVFARDVVALSGFYSEVFGFPEIEAIRSPIFRGIDAGGTAIGFNALDAYELLKLQDFAETKGVKFLLNIDVDTVDEVEKFWTKLQMLARQTGEDEYALWQPVR